MKNKNNPTITKNKFPNNKIKNEVGDEYEFSDELFEIDDITDYRPFNGGMNTRNLVEKAEKVLAESYKNNNKS